MTNFTKIMIMQYRVGKFKRIVGFFITLSLISNTNSCTIKNLESPAEIPPYTIGEVLISDDFSGNLSLWSVEGESPDIKDGHLEFDSSGFSVIWLKPSLVGNVMIEYDITILDQDEAADITGGFGCFAMATDPGNPNKFFSSSKERAGDISRYKDLNLYYFELSCEENKSIQVLKYDHGKEEQLNRKSNSLYKKMPDQKYHVKLLFFEGWIEFEVNEEFVFRYEDIDLYSNGNFGITAADGKYLIDDFVIKHLKKND